MAAPRTRRTRALVLDHTKLKEQDLILTLLCENGEQARAVAKGARKPTGRLASRTQLFSEADLLLAKGRSLDVVAEATLVDGHPGIAGELERVSAASVVCEVARRTSYEDAPDPYLFGLARRALQAVATVPLDGTAPAALDLAVAAYVLKALSHQGWRPETGACVACGDEAPTWFSAQMGGALCSSCVRDVPGAVPAEKGELAWVAALVGLTFDQLADAPCDLPCAHWLLEQAHLWAATHLECRVRSFEFLLGL